MGMAERGKEERSEQSSELEAVIKKHEDLIPTVLKTQVKVDLYWKCYAYGDELKPHIEFLDGIMLSSTRDIAPSCVENVDELIERQEKSLSQLETKRAVVKELIAKGKQLLENPDKPKFLDSHVKRIEEGWDDTKDKAQSRLTLLQSTKDAWVGYAEGLETIATEFEKGDEEIKKIKKRFNLASAFEDLEKRQKIFQDTKNTIEGQFNAIEKNYDCMTMTLPEDKKDFVKKEVKAVSEKLVVVEKFREKVEKIENFVNRLDEFDKSLKSIDVWMKEAETQLNDIKNNSDKKAKEAEEKRKRLEEAEKKRQAMMQAQKEKQQAAGQGAKGPKKTDSGMGNVQDARREMTKTKEQLEEEKKISLSIRIKPLDLDAMDGDQLTNKASELWDTIVRLETEKYDLEERQKRQDYDLKELKERQKQQLRQKAMKRLGP